jgi:5-methylcytosine-specific restriction protein A
MSMKPRNYQPKHRRDSNRNFNGRKRIDAMYDTEWESYRESFLRINPECYACGETATVVDHLRPHKGDETLFKKTDNHIPLCAICHNTVTTLFDRNFRIGSPITKKIEWLNRNRAGNRDWVPRRVKVLPKYG